MKKIKQFIKQIYWSFNYSFKYKINNTKIIGLKLYQSKSEVSERWMGQILEKLLHLTEDLFVDVGVNLGQTLCQIKSIDPDRDYIGFEPNFACNLFVEEIIRLNNFTNTKIIPVGLFTSNSILELDLYHDDITNAGGSLIQNYWEFNNIHPSRKLMVPVMTFETICKNTKMKKLGIVKIDVEGAELEVFESMLFKIEKDRPFFIVEIISAFSQENTLRIERQQKIISIFENLNYLIYRILRDKDENLIGINQIFELDPTYDHNQCNYLIIPTEQKNKVNKVYADLLM